MRTEQDKLAADLLEQVGNLAGGMGGLFGQQGAAAGMAVKAITHHAARAIRLRGATVDDIVQSLKKIESPKMPWNPAHLERSDK